MQPMPIQITFRHMHASPSLEAHIQQLAAALRTRFHRVLRCDVVMERRNHQHNHDICHARIHVGVPGKEIVVSRACSDRAAHDDIYAGVDAAFAVVGRQLEQNARRASPARVAIDAAGVLSC